MTNPIPKVWSRRRDRSVRGGVTILVRRRSMGMYTFENVSLSTVKGISGNLTSEGTFDGQLGRIGVKGTTHTPDFQVNISSNPVPLDTRFEAVVDGTDGDTYLNSVVATFLQTSLTSRGAIVGAEGVKGKTINLHVKIDSGRVEDVLRLGVKGDKPVMTGALGLHADMDLPAGPEDVMDRLQLAGTFSRSRMSISPMPRFRNKLSDLSERARGLDPDEHQTRVASNLHGQFRLKDSGLSLRDAEFDVPGALVKVGGNLRS